MKRLSDENIIKAALNIYDKHLRKLEDQSPMIVSTHKRVQEMIHNQKNDLISPHFRG